MNRNQRRIGILVLAGVVAMAPAQAMAGDLTTSIKSAMEEAVAEQARQQRRQLTERDWQRDYDRALARKGGGKSKMILGAVALAGGIALRQYAIGSCTADLTNYESFDAGSCGTAASLADVAMIANWTGIGVFGWGVAQFITANGELKRLEDQRPDDVTLGPGTRHHGQLAAFAPSVSYRVRW